MSTYTLDDLLNDNIEEDLTWDTFSPLVKGMPRKHKSALWTAYKEEDYEVLVSIYQSMQDGTFDVEEVEEDNTESEEEEVEEVPVEPEEEVEEEVEEVDYIAEYTRLSNKLLRFGPSMPEEKVKEMMLLMKEYASKTIDPKYTVSDTDAWEIWMGPTSKCLLINSTRRLSFICSRSWWTKHYLNAMYVSRQLVSSNEQFDRLVAEKKATKRFIGRHPLPGIEIKLPTTAKEFHLRDR
jgi:hypothetical protein